MPTEDGSTTSGSTNSSTADVSSSLTTAEVATTPSSSRNVASERDEQSSPPYEPTETSSIDAAVASTPSNVKETLTFPSDVVENGSESSARGFEMQNSLIELDSIMSDSGDASSFPSNTLDDVSSLRTIEETHSPTQSEKSDIGQSEDVNHSSIHGDQTEDVTPPSSSSQEPTDGNDEDEDGWMDVIGSGDLMKKVIRKGRGQNTRPTRGNIVTVNIVGRLEDGEEVDVAQGAKVFLGDAEVVQGLELAIPLMELNEVAEILVKPRLAYGKMGREPDVPPDVTVTYQVELLAVENEPDQDTLSFSERKNLGNQKRERGNFWFSRGEYSCALQCYRRAMDFLDDASTNFTDVSEEQHELAETWLKVSNNMAAAQLKIGAYEPALKSVENVLKVQPDNVKALFRKGKILSSMGKFEDAIKTMRQALALEPETKIIHQELASLVAKRKSDVKVERELYRRMLGQDRAETADKSTAKNRNKFNLLQWGFFAGGISAAFLGLFAFKHYHAD